MSLTILWRNNPLFFYLNNHSTTLLNSPFHVYLFPKLVKINLDNECWEIIVKKKMDNYPKIEVVDIGNCNQLNESTKKAIEDCLEKKSKMQMAKDPKYYAQE